MLKRTLAALALAFAANADAGNAAYNESATEVGAQAGYTLNRSSYGDEEGLQFRMGGSTSHNVLENADLLLDTRFVMNYYGFDNPGVQKDSLTDINALLMYNGFENMEAGGGLNLFFYDGLGQFADSGQMVTTDYAIGPVLRAEFLDNPFHISFDYSLGFGQYGDNREGEHFSLKNRLGIALGASFSDFGAEFESGMSYNYMPFTGHKVFETGIGLSLSYRFLDFMAATAFYEHEWVFGEEEKDEADSVGAGLSLMF